MVVGCVVICPEHENTHKFQWISVNFLVDVLVDVQQSKKEMHMNFVAKLLLFLWSFSSAQKHFPIVSFLHGSQSKHTKHDCEVKRQKEWPAKWQKVVSTLHLLCFVDVHGALNVVVNVGGMCVRTTSVQSVLKNLRPFRCFPPSMKCEPQTKKEKSNNIVFDFRGLLSSRVDGLVTRLKPSGILTF